jgi:hypothetical protein
MDAARPGKDAPAGPVSLRSFGETGLVVTGSARRPTPCREDLLDLIADLFASERAIEAAQEEGIVGGALVADGGDDGQRQSLFVQPASGGGPPDAPASPDGGVLGNSLGLGRGAAGEKLLNPPCHR